MRKIFFILILIFNCCLGIAQERFYKTYSLKNIKQSPKLVLTKDKGYILMFKTDKPYWQTHLIKYNKCGVQLWAKSLQAFEAREVCELKNGNLLLSSGTYYEPTLIKLDANGTIIFQKSYTAGATYSIVYSSGGFSNGDLILSGFLQMNSSGSVNYNFIIKTDSVGNIKWSKKYAVLAGKIQTCSDGGVLACFADLTFKTDSSGNVEWSYIYGPFYGQKALEINDGFILVKYNVNLAKDTGYIYKINKQGNIKWISQGFNINRITGIKKRSNGNFILLGNVRLNSNNVFRPTIIEADSLGQFLNQIIYNPTNSNTYVSGDLALLENGTMLFTGTEGDPRARIFLAKTSQSLTVGCADSTVNENYSSKNFTVSNYPLTATDIPFNPIVSNIVILSDTILSQKTCQGYDSLNFSFPNNLCVYPGFSLNLQGPPGYDYLWSTGSTASNISVYQSGTYALYILDPCSGQIINQTNIFVNSCVDVAIKKNMPRSIFNIYPNPTSGQLTISGAIFKNISITNLIGQQIFIKNFPLGSVEEKIELSQFPKGIYFIELSDETYSKSLKFVLD